MAPGLGREDRIHKEPASEARMQTHEREQQEPRQAHGKRRLTCLNRDNCHEPYEGKWTISMSLFLPPELERLARRERIREPRSAWGSTGQRQYVQTRVAWWPWPPAERGTAPGAGHMLLG